SPRRFGPTQLPSATELWHTPTRTFTVLMWRPHRRTHSRENGNPGLFSFFDSRFRGSEETRNAEMNYIKQMPALFVVLFWFTVISFFSTSSHAQPALKRAHMRRFATHVLFFALSVLFFCGTLISFFSQPRAAHTPLKKVRMGSSSTNVSFLALYTAVHRGFFKDEGIDLEIIYMPANLASTAVLSGDIDYNGAVTGTIGAAVRGQPMKVLLFTVAKPFLFLVSKKDIKDVKQLRGKKIAGSSPGGSATLIAEKVLKHYGLEPGRDVSLLPRGGSAAGRYAVLETGVVDASFLSVPE